jgi:hypothetical protein
LLEVSKGFKKRQGSRERGIVPHLNASQGKIVGDCDLCYASLHGRGNVSFPPAASVKGKRKILSVSPFCLTPNPHYYRINWAMPVSVEFRILQLIYCMDSNSPEILDCQIFQFFS